MKKSALFIGLLAVAGCETGLRLDVAQPPVEPLTQARPVRLAWRLPENTPLNYLFRFSARTRGGMVLNEESEGIVHIINEGRTNEQFMRVVLRRQELKRKQVEYRRGRQIIETKLRDFQPWISPNTLKAQPASSQVAHPVDDCWRFGIREGTPFHFLFYDSLTYLLPAFIQKEVSPGEEWSVRIPVIVNRAHNRNEFPLKCTHRLERLLRLPGGRLGADVSFTVEGRFDTSGEDYAHRFDDAFRSNQRIVNTVTGEGRVLFDADAGLLVWKEIRYTVDVTRASAKTTRSAGGKVARTDWEETTDRMEVEAVWRLRQPGERIPVDQ